MSRNEETFGFKVFYWTFMLVCICTPPVGWFILFMMSDYSIKRGPGGVPGTPFYPAPQPVYMIPPPPPPPYRPYY
jgi:hypothetical protein